MDDYSRDTCIYLLKSRSDVFSTFKAFHSEINNQLNFSIKILRSDNAKKYPNNTFNQFLEQNKIMHQSSYVYTKHNGVVKCKNRLLLDLARTLLFHRQVPKNVLR